MLNKDFIKSCYKNFDRLNINQSYKENVKDIARSWVHICSVSCEVSNFEDITTTVRGLIENEIDKEHSIIEIFENIDAYYKEYKQKPKQ